MSNFTTRKRNRIGPRFGELMGKHCHQALTAAARGRREEYYRHVADIYQMLDTVEQETNWNDQPAPVAPKSKRPAQGAGDTAKDPEGPKPAEPTVRKRRSPNQGKKRAASPGGAGKSNTGNAVVQSDVPEGEK